jgi:hypothetical protein
VNRTLVALLGYLVAQLAMELVFAGTPSRVWPFAPPLPSRCCSTDEVGARVREHITGVRLEAGR